MKIFIAIIGLVIGFFGAKFYFDKDVSEKIVYKYFPKDTVYIPLPKDSSIKNVYIPIKVKGKDSLVIDTLIEFYDVDTARIIEEYVNVSKRYNSEYFYKDSVTYNNGYILIKDTLSKNSITGRSLYFNIPQITKEIIKEKPPTTKVYGGLNIGTGLGVGTGIKTKKDWVYSIDYFYNFQGSNLIIGVKKPLLTIP